MKSFWKKIDKKKKILDQKRPLPKNALKSLKQKLMLEWTYHSNAIEGNTLTLSETKVALEGITVGGKSVKEHLEIINHSKAIEYLENLVLENKSLSEWEIKQIHSIVLKDIDSENSGVYRKEKVFITGARHTPPDYTAVLDEMQNFIKLYNKAWSKLHPVERSALLHIEFVKIHPFIDGNGRTARLLQNLELMKYGFPPIVIKKEQRLKYYQALDKAHTKGQMEDFFKLSSDCADQSLDLYLSIAQSEE